MHGTTQKCLLNKEEENLVVKSIQSSKFDILLGFLRADGSINRLVAKDDLVASVCLLGEKACLWGDKWHAVYDCESIYDDQFNSAKHGIAVIVREKNQWFKKTVPHNRQRFVDRLYSADGTHKSRLESLLKNQSINCLLAKFPTNDALALLEYFGGDDIEINRLAKSLVNVFRYLRIELLKTVLPSMPRRRLSYSRIVEIMLSNEVDSYDLAVLSGIPEEEKTIDKEEYELINAKIKPMAGSFDPSLMCVLSDKLKQMLASGPRTWDSSAEETNRGFMPVFASYAEKDEAPIQQFTNVQDVLKMLGMGG